MSYSRKVICPRCGKTADKTTAYGQDKLTGAPYRVCPECGCNYFDPWYCEPAIEAFNDKGGGIGLLGTLGTLLYNSFFIWSLIAAIKGDKNCLWICILLGGYLILLDYSMIKRIKKRMNTEVYHEEIVDLLEGRSAKLPEKYAESMERLSDRGYLDALRSHGVDVPEYFYQRLGYGTEGCFVEPENLTVITICNVKERWI